MDKKPIRRGLYLLPSLFTFGNVVLGFYAVVVGLRGSLEIAAILVYLAAILDGLDGRIARLTNTESEFGKQFDTLADVLTFGAAPALLAFIWQLENYGRIGWLIPVLYVLCASIRLARFNVQTRSVDTRYFVGLPAPAAAATVVSILYFWPQPLGAGASAAIAMMITLLGVATLMISTFRYRSFKDFDLRRRWSYRMAALLAVLLLLIVYDPPAVFFSAAVLYTVSGPAEWLLRRIWRTQKATSRDGSRREVEP